MHMDMVPHLPSVVQYKPVTYKQALLDFESWYWGQRGQASLKKPQLQSGKLERKKTHSGGRNINNRSTYKPLAARRIIYGA